MGLTSHISDAYDTFSSLCASFSSLLGPMKMSLKNIAMKVMVQVSPLVRAFIHFLNYPLIVLVDCHQIKSQYLLVVSAEYFQGSKFPTQKLL